MHQQGLWPREPHGAARAKERILAHLTCPEKKNESDRSDSFGMHCQIHKGSPFQRLAHAGGVRRR